MKILFITKWPFFLNKVLLSENLIKVVFMLIATLNYLIASLVCVKQNIDVATNTKMHFRKIATSWMNCEMYRNVFSQVIYLRASRQRRMRILRRLGHSAAACLGFTLLEYIVRNGGILQHSSIWSLDVNQRVGVISLTVSDTSCELLLVMLIR